ncbi:hypothetical protein [Nocardia jinanensis]|uniref:Uncharacterized protein n=1 Tax=Nocardia jinanensis TaxID=382504 RepID=A0A917VUM6_9NOCA|nr:hypothetical protein [Nocardia jinanensis]GGL20628.1 hypothetical protein GCM10011588_39340 [Nocardia jinanensis]
MSTLTTDPARTTAEDALWAVINTEPTTAADLATAADISQSKARKILNQWASDGSVTRHTDNTNTRAAARWSIATTEPGESTETVSHAVDTGDSPTHHDINPLPDTGDTSDSEFAISLEQATETEPATGPAPAGQNSEESPNPDKLASGALRGLVEDHLRDNPGEEFTPHQIANALGGRSSGAVHNALVKLAKTGIAEQTCDRPKKFALTPDPQ